MSTLRRWRSAGQLVSHILERPDLVAEVQTLGTEPLAALVRRIGVEDAAELLALVTSEQLVELFDSELWDEQSGQAELAPERFARWLEVLSESGDRFVADRLAALPEELLAHALDGQLIVLDLDSLALTFSERAADELLDKALCAPLSHELDHYLLLSKRNDGWDAVISAVLALDFAHPHALAPVLDRLCAVAMEQVEDEGLSSVLSEAESLAEDAVAGREDRRAQHGYVSAADARAFESLMDEPGELLSRPERDAITKAYFRRLRTEPSAHDPSSALRDLLVEAGVAPRQARPALPGPGASAAELLAALQRLAESHPNLYGERQEELAFLTNVLLSSALAQGRALRPVDAARAAVAACNRGLTWALAQPGAPAEPLVVLGLDVLYRIGRSAPVARTTAEHGGGGSRAAGPRATGPTARRRRVAPGARKKTQRPRR